MGAGDRVKQFGRSVALISQHGHSWTVMPTRRANNCCHAAHAAPFLADTVWQSHRHSLSSSAYMPSEIRMHDSRLHAVSMRYVSKRNKQRGGLGLCQTHDASAAIKPVPRRPEKGYATGSRVDPLLALLATCSPTPYAIDERCFRENSYAVEGPIP